MLKEGISSALDECQVYHKKFGFDQKLTINQLATIKSMDLFKDIDGRYKSKNLSKYGGLAAFCSQFVGNMVRAINDGNNFSDEAKELGQKIANISIAIGTSLPGLQLTKADMPYIESACHAAIALVKNDPLLAEINKFTKQVV